MNDHRNAGWLTLQGSMEGIATITAAITAFVLTPDLYGRTMPWISDLTERHYGAAYVDLASFVWFALVGLLVFFTARAVTSIVIVMGGLYLAARYL